MPSFEQNLEKYAEVIVKVGLNLQPGQRLLIGASAFSNMGAPLESVALVRAVTTKAYDAGARYVDVIWDDGQLNLVRFQHAPRDSFEELSRWKIDTTYEYGERGDALLVIYAEDPDLLSGQDTGLVATAQQASFQHVKPVLKLIEKNATNWLVASAPVSGWSAKVLPDVPPESREARMWDLIFEMCRVKQPDPVA